MNEITATLKQDDFTPWVKPEGLQYEEPVFTLSNGDKIVVDDHCYVIVSTDGKLRQWLYKEALVALKGLPIPS